MEDFIPTRGSQMKKHVSEEFVLVNYESRKRAKKNDDSDKDKDALPDETDETTTMTKETKDMDQKKKQELEMKRIRYEVMKFGMSGFQKAEANKAKVQLAISLGAKPPKNRRMNYKHLKERREREREMQKKAEHTSGLEMSMIKHKSKKKISKVKKSNDILEVYGKVTKKPEGKKKR
nr:uncharacterized protein C1orf131 [Nomia melanderi]